MLLKKDLDLGGGTGYLQLLKEDMKPLKEWGKGERVGRGVGRG